MTAARTPSSNGRPTRAAIAGLRNEFRCFGFGVVCLSGGPSDDAAIATLATIWRKTGYGTDPGET